MKQLFEYAVVYHNYEKNQGMNADVVSEIYKDSKMIINPTTILAKDEKEVIFKVTRLIDAEYAENPDHVQIMIRNF